MIKPSGHFDIESLNILLISFILPSLILRKFTSFQYLLKNKLKIHYFDDF